MGKIIVVALVLALTAGASSAKGSGSSHSVRGHATKNGTHVPPHRATNPDGRKSNNWNQKGNVNPYTGRDGTKN